MQTNRTLYYHGTHRAPYRILAYFLRMIYVYEVRIDILNLFLMRVGPVVADGIA